MKHYFQYLLVITAAATLTACAPMAPAPSGTSWPDPPSSQKSPSSPPPSKPTIRSTESAPESATNPAVTSLVNQGWRYYQQDNYEGALSVAERAQRIDPRSPEVYLLMASARFSLYQLNIAEQLARRGLAVAQSGSAVSRQLQSLLGKIATAR